MESRQRDARSVRRNIGANLVGQIWSAALQLIFVPLYVRLLGIEGYGLLGFYVTLQATLQVLDLGLSPTMNRQLARYSALGDAAIESRDFVYTLQALYWAIGLAIGALVYFLAPQIAVHWIHGSHIPVEDVTYAVRLMGVLVMFQWPVSFVSGGLIGLQRLEFLNAVKVVGATLAALGAAAILVFVRSSVDAFLTWQIFATVLQVVALSAGLWRFLPPSTKKSEMKISLVRSVWRFAAGMSGISLSALILTQCDKIVLIRLLPLAEFGYYSLAWTVASGLYVLIGSIFNGIFPRFAAMVAVNNEEGLRGLYHKASQIMALLVLPPAAVMAAYPNALLLAWTGNGTIAHRAGPLLALLALGTALNGLMNLPYALQLAYGWTRIGFLINLTLVVILVPTVIVLARLYGAIGGASVWLMLNLIYMALAVPLTHRRLLRGEALHWAWRDAALPALAAFGISIASRLVFGAADTRLGALLLIAAVSTITLAGTLLVSVEPRRAAAQWLTGRQPFASLGARG